MEALLVLAFAHPEYEGTCKLRCPQERTIVRTECRVSLDNSGELFALLAVNTFRFPVENKRNSGHERIYDLPTTVRKDA